MSVISSFKSVENKYGVYGGNIAWKVLKILKRIQTGNNYFWKRKKKKKNLSLTKEKQES